MEKPRLVALLWGPDQPGLVARVSGWIYGRGGNILHADQHRDAEENVFFQRLEWIPRAIPRPEATGARDAAADEGEDASREGEAFAAFAADELGMRARVVRSDALPRFALFVSKIPHCFHDILLRARMGEFQGRIACVVSNHPDLREAAEAFGLPFHHVPIPRRDSPDRETAEAEQVRVCRESGAETVVLARYMQILSPRQLEDLGMPVINIHHSFLPAFAGGRPYHQAYARGVKLIGATAHYATADLDEGPIIHQDVTRVSHRHSVTDLTRRGRDLEKTVLAQALRWHLESRILVYNNKTVVFD